MESPEKWFVLIKQMSDIGVVDVTDLNDPFFTNIPQHVCHRAVSFLFREARRWPFPHLSAH